MKNSNLLSQQSLKFKEISPKHWQQAINKINIMKRFKRAELKGHTTKETVYMQSALTDILQDDQKNVQVKDIISSCSGDKNKIKGMGIEHDSKRMGWDNFTANILSPFGNNIRDYIKLTAITKNNIEDLTQIRERDKDRKKQLRAIPTTKPNLAKLHINQHAQNDYTSKEKNTLEMFTKVFEDRRNRDKFLNAPQIGKDTKKIFARCSFMNPTVEKKISNVERRKDSNFIAIFQKEIDGDRTQNTKNNTRQHRNLYTLNPILSKAHKSKNHSQIMSSSFNDYFNYDNDMNRILFEDMSSDMNKLQRGKSCYCSQCGGQKYYEKYQAIINNILLPATQERLGMLKKEEIIEEQEMLEIPIEAPKPRRSATLIPGFKRKKTFSNNNRRASQTIGGIRFMPRTSILNSILKKTNTPDLTKGEELGIVEEQPIPGEYEDSSSTFSSFTSIDEDLDSIEDNHRVLVNEEVGIRTSNLFLPKTNGRQSNMRKSFMNTAFDKFFHKPQNPSSLSINSMSNDTQEYFRGITEDLKQTVEKVSMSKKGKLGIGGLYPVLSIEPTPFSPIEEYLYDESPDPNPNNNKMPQIHPNWKSIIPIPTTNAITPSKKGKRRCSQIVSSKRNTELSTSPPNTLGVKNIMAFSTAFKRMKTMGSQFKRTDSLVSDMSSKSPRFHIPHSQTEDAINAYLRARKAKERIFKPLGIITPNIKETNPIIEVDELQIPNTERGKRKSHKKHRRNKPSAQDPKHIKSQSERSVEDLLPKAQVTTAGFKFYSISALQRPKYFKHLKQGGINDTESKNIRTEESCAISRDIYGHKNSNRIMSPEIEVSSVRNRNNNSLIPRPLTSMLDSPKYTIKLPKAEYGTTPNKQYAYSTRNSNQLKYKFDLKGDERLLEKTIQDPINLKGPSKQKMNLHNNKPFVVSLKKEGEGYGRSSGFSNKSRIDSWDITATTTSKILKSPKLMDVYGNKTVLNCRSVPTLLKGQTTRNAKNNKYLKLI